jgi:hypothetical protein
MHLAIQSCICYNALRQKWLVSIRQKKRIPRLYCNTIGGFFFSFYSGKAPTRLFVVHVVTIKPFNDVVAGYTTHYSHKKSG